MPQGLEANRANPHRTARRALSRRAMRDRPTGPGVGGGDWKLAAAIGAIKGYPFVIYAIFYSSLVGAAIALGHLAYHGRLISGLGRSAKKAVGVKVTPLEKGDPTEDRIPYGVAMA